MEEDLYADLALSEEESPKAEQACQNEGQTEMDLMDEGLTSKFKMKTPTQPSVPRVDIQVEKLKHEVKTLKEQNETLEQNLVLLYKTAHHILKLKDKELSNLKTKYDAMCFRRRNQDNSAALPSIAPCSSCVNNVVSNANSGDIASSQQPPQTSQRIPDQPKRPHMSKELSMLQNYLPQHKNHLKKDEAVVIANGQTSEARSKQAPANPLEGEPPGQVALQVINRDQQSSTLRHENRMSRSVQPYDKSRTGETKSDRQSKDRGKPLSSPRPRNESRDGRENRDGSRRDRKRAREPSPSLCSTKKTRKSNRPENYGSKDKNNNSLCRRPDVNHADYRSRDKKTSRHNSRESTRNNAEVVRRDNSQKNRTVSDRDSRKHIDRVSERNSERNIGGRNERVTRRDSNRDFGRMRDQVCRSDCDRDLRRDIDSDSKLNSREDCRRSSKEDIRLNSREDCRRSSKEDNRLISREEESKSSNKDTRKNKGKNVAKEDSRETNNDDTRRNKCARNENSRRPSSRSSRDEPTGLDQKSLSSTQDEKPSHLSESTAKASDKLVAPPLEEEIGALLREEGEVTSPTSSNGLLESTTEAPNNSVEPPLENNAPHVFTSPPVDEKVSRSTLASNDLHEATRDTPSKLMEPPGGKESPPMVSPPVPEEQVKNSALAPSQSSKPTLETREDSPDSLLEAILDKGLPQIDPSLSREEARDLICIASSTSSSRSCSTSSSASASTPELRRSPRKTAQVGRSVEPVIPKPALAEKGREEIPPSAEKLSLEEVNVRLRTGNGTPSREKNSSSDKSIKQDNRLTSILLNEKSAHMYRSSSRPLPLGRFSSIILALPH